MVEEMQTQVKVITTNNQLTFTEKIKEIIEQLTDEQKNNNTFILLLETWLILNREKNETLEHLKTHIEDLKNTFEILVREAIDAKEIIPIDSRSLAETIYTFIETFTLQRTYSNVDAETKMKSLKLLIDGLKV